MTLSAAREPSTRRTVTRLTSSSSASSRSVGNFAWGASPPLISARTWSRTRCDGRASLSLPSVATIAFPSSRLLVDTIAGSRLPGRVHPDGRDSPGSGHVSRCVRCEPLTTGRIGVDHDEVIGQVGVRHSFPQGCHPEHTRLRGPTSMKTVGTTLSIGLLGTALLLAGCSPAADPGGSSADPSTTSSASGTVTVWDYYGQATPLKKSIAEFSKAHPEITVDYQAFDYEAFHSKFPVSVAAGQAPDL